MSSVADGGERDMSWLPLAACKGADVNLFYTPDGERGRAVQERQARAKQVCNRCPVKRRCLDDAIDRKERFGVSGGMTPIERDQEVARREISDDGHDESVISRLVSGEDVPDAHDVDVAHACIRIWQCDPSVKQVDLARRFGYAPSTVRRWVARSNTGQLPIDPNYLVTRNRHPVLSRSA